MGTWDRESLGEAAALRYLTKCDFFYKIMYNTTCGMEKGENEASLLYKVQV